MQLSDLYTGDLLLFDEHPSSGWMGWLDWAIQRETQCRYSHSAIVLRDPTFLSPILKGVFVWESSYHGTPDPQDGQVKLGVQITPIEQYTRRYPGSVRVFVRKCPEDARPKFHPSILKRIHDKVHDKPYDLFPLDWYRAYEHAHNSLPTDKRFFCSAFCTYVLAHVGIVASTTDWTTMSCRDLMSDSNAIRWMVPYGVEQIVQ